MTLAYITSNSWIKTKYGGLLRRYFKSCTDPLVLIDFENSQVFETAIVESNIFILKKSEFMNHLEALQFNLISEKPFDIKNYFSNNHVILETLDDAGWIISNSLTSLLRKKMKAGSDPLIDLNQRIYIGILNGYNDAYIINSKIRQELIEKNPRCAEIIKPLLRGRDVGRYYYQWQNLWLINSHNGIKNRLPRVDVEKDYPAIYDFLIPHREKLEIRKNRGTDWTNLRNCSYFEKFEEPKIIWGELSDKPKFTYVGLTRLKPYFQYRWAFFASYIPS